jgi:hypothetical protein
VSLENSKYCQLCSAWHILTDTLNLKDFGYCSRYDLKTKMNECCESCDLIVKNERFTPLIGK